VRTGRLVGALVLLGAAGCAGGGAGSSGKGGSPGSTGGTPGSGGSGGPSGTGGTSTFTLSCPSPQLGTPELRLLTATELQNSINSAFPGISGQWTASLPASTISPQGFDNDASASVGSQMAGAILDMGVSVGTAVTGSQLNTLLPCASSASSKSTQDSCAQTFLGKYGQRLFRRPLSSDEQTRYMAFFDSSLGKSDFKTALKWLTAALIQSPYTLHRSEIGNDMGNGTRQLTPYEVATELAYTYTGTSPSDDLLTAAGNNSLGDLAAQARTLMATSQGQQVLQHFFEQYLEYAGVSSLQKPNISNFASVSQDMAQETRAFITDVVINKQGGLKELLTAQTTNPSKALATYYASGNGSSVSFPAPSSDYASVMRPAGSGVGVLAQGSFLATHAAADHDSPTKRGLFVFYKLFCNPKLTPPPNVPPLDTTTVMADVHTTRDRYEKVHELTQGATGACHNCHVYFDPIGFGFEHFDEGGRYRTQEGTYPVDSSDSVTAPDGTTLNFTGQDDLMGDLMNEPVIHQCIQAYLATYAYGTNEACIGSSEVPDLQSGAIGLAEAYARLATESHFTKRTSTE
jgi:Protein of unknown function (DUF1588)/Protein of unknown function (DUF1592)/Protein of unknown function (DUF1595)